MTTDYNGLLARARVDVQHGLNNQKGIHKSAIDVKLRNPTMAMMNLPKSEGSLEEIPQKPPTFLNTVKAVVFKNLFPISLVFFVALGILAPEPGVFFSKLPTHYVCVIGIFLHSGLKLKTGEVTDAFKAFKALIWGVICILLITPIVGGHLTGLLPYTVTKGHATTDRSDINGSNSWNGTSLSPEENPRG